MSTLNTLIRKASCLLKIGSEDVPPKEFFDGEVTFCKNNVCVHPPTTLRTEITHHPGYLSIREQTDEVLGSTLILTWIPNAMLKKNPHSLENKTPESSPCRSTYSSKCPSPTPGNKSPLHLPYSDSYFPYSCNEKSIDEFLHFRPSSLQSDRKSISSTISDIGSPREDCGSLDSFSISDHTDMTASTCSQSLMNDIDDIKSMDISVTTSMVSCKMESSMSSAANEVQSQSDSGIGPEEVVAALEKMICGLNNIDHSKAECDATHNTDSTANLNSSLDSYNIEVTSTNKDRATKEKLGQAESNECNIEKCFDKKNELRLCLPQNLNADAQNTSSTNPDISISTHSPDHTDSSSTTQTTSNRDPDSMPSTPGSPSDLPNHSVHHQISKYLYVESTAESVARLHNLNFPDMPSRNSDKCSIRENACGVFSVDLSQMRSLRLFFSNIECTCGQLVVASRESQYKILHFHHGGLNKLAKIFEEYNFLTKPKNKGTENCPYRQFSICRPEVTKEECHPEEGIYNIVDEIRWRAFVNAEGLIEDNLQLRKEIFFGGLDSKIRKEAWPFLLHHYDFSSSFDDREQLKNDKYIEYQGIRWKRDQMSEEDKDIFWRNIQCTVEKDVVRTDRSNPFFSGENNPNIEIMMNILLNYGFYNPKIGYTQGMSDLLAPILAAVQDESDSFWCFVGLMQRTIFVTCPKDFDMDVNLHFLRELFRLMRPKFYEHLCKYEALELLFVHRWILLCFKREFTEYEAMRMWEACWAHYQTDYFHLFICCAIVAIYGDDVIAQELRADEMMVHFSSLAMHMNGELVLRKARGLLHQFRLLSKIPCSLSKLCELCGPGMWDSRHVPIVYCTGDHEDHFCPYEGENPILKSP